ncbi:6519_t:CDS:2, partial [Paraglomus brasilianum]
MSSISTGLSQRWIRHHKLLMSPAPTLKKISLDPSSIPHNFTYVTAVSTIASKPNITETTVSFDATCNVCYSEKYYLQRHQHYGSPPSSHRAIIARSVAEQSPPQKTKLPPPSQDHRVGKLSQAPMTT